MANTSNSDKWYFTKEQLEGTPSRKCGFDAYKELQYRQQAANFIQDMGQRLKVSQLCINTAIVYMHRFYVFHSFTNFPWHQMAAAALFLAAKVEEQPRKLEYVIRVANSCKNPRDTSFDINSERYIAQSQDLVFNENVLLQTLGFDVAIDHPHTYVVRCCHLVRASKDLAQTSYFMASNSLHLTTMCIQYKPTVVACFCILLACKWSNWEIPLSNEKKEWYTYVDQSVTAELLEQLTSEFLVIFENCPSRLKEKIMALMAMSDNNIHTPSQVSSSSSPFDTDPKKTEGPIHKALEFKGSDDPHKHRSRPHEAISSGHQTREQKEREYKERKEREKLALMSGMTLPPHPSHHHRPDRSIDPKLKSHSRPPSSGPHLPLRNEPRDILREASRDASFGLPTIRDPSREHAKDPHTSRSEKEVPKRDPLLKANVQTDPNNMNNYSDVRQRIDPSRSRIDPSKSASKQDMMRRYEEQKPHVKSETDNIKKHLSSGYDKNSAYHKSSSSTSQKIKSPFSLDSKSVPKTIAHAGAPPKMHYNGSSNGSYSKPPPHENEAKHRPEPVHVKDEIPTPPVIKRPSLFSPEKTPPHQKPVKNESLTTLAQTNLSDLSPITSPPSVRRNRNYSSSSEPELRPTMKKIDQVEGFENLMRDSTIGMANIHNAPDTIPLVKTEEPCLPVVPKTETKSELASHVKEHVISQSAIVNGLETNPTLISNLLKEAATSSHLPGVALIKTEPAETEIAAPEQKDKDHHPHKSKKKKEKHKHKDKDKSKEEKEKKKKHRDKDREKHKHRDKKEVAEPPLMSEPIKITIQKDKIQPLTDGLKIKIPKDKIRTEGIVDPLPQPSSGGLKIKIPKDVIINCSTSSNHSIDISVSSSSSNRKRERDRTSQSDMPPAKLSKSSHRESKQNGRHSYGKVSQNEQPSSNLLPLLSAENSRGSVSQNVSGDFAPHHQVNALPTSSTTIETQQNSISNIVANFSISTTPPHNINTFKKNNVSSVTQNYLSLPQSGSTTPPLQHDSYKKLYKKNNLPLSNAHRNNPTYPNNHTPPYHPNDHRNFSYTVKNPPPYPTPPYRQKPHMNSGGQRPPRGYSSRGLPSNPQIPNIYHPPPQQNSAMFTPPSAPQMHYATYQMPPPTLPNLNVPPPAYGLYPGYYGYMYPEMYPQQLGGGINNPPPLPSEAPPSEVPPPPPPE